MPKVNRLLLSRVGFISLIPAAISSYYINILLKSMCLCVTPVYHFSPDYKYILLLILSILLLDRFIYIRYIKHFKKK
jgi:hypothetical protein